MTKIKNLFVEMIRGEEGAAYSVENIGVAAVALAIGAGVGPFLIEACQKICKKYLTSR